MAGVLPHQALTAELNRLQLYSEWHFAGDPAELDLETHRSKEANKTKTGLAARQLVGRSHSEGSLNQNPVGGLRVLKTLLALTRGGPCPLIVGSGLVRNRARNCGPAPALEPDVGFTVVPERVNSCPPACA